jgi:hypothetical protein
MALYQNFKEFLAGTADSEAQPLFEKPPAKRAVQHNDVHTCAAACFVRDSYCLPSVKEVIFHRKKRSVF